MILVVDDDDILRRAIVRILRPSGTVLEARDGVEALEILEKNPKIDRVLTDGQMPNLDGRGLIHELDRKGTRVRIGVVSSDAGTLSFAQERGLQYLAKPFEPPALAAMVMRL